MTKPTVPSQFADDLVAEVPPLRVFARSLTINHALADDLVQETVLKAWNNWKSFTPGSNLRAWLFTILRNTFLNGLAKRKREVEDINGAYAKMTVEVPRQGGIPDMVDFRRALSTLPADQREALVLVGAAGFTYEEAAQICGSAVGTIKSRVNRARQTLSAMLRTTPEDLNSVEPATMSVLIASEAVR